MSIVKVLGISGSPRAGGNSETLLAEALKGASSRGAEARMVELRASDIGHCQGCNACFSDGECRIEDGMSPLYELVAEADVIILASPVYFSGMSSVMKQFIDRCQSLWARKEVLGQRVGGPGRRGALISVGGQGSPVFRNSISVAKSLFNSIDVEYQGELTAADVDSKGEVFDKPWLLREARELGERLVDRSDAAP